MNLKIDKLKEAVQLCSIHAERMNFARDRITRHFPLNRQKYLQLEQEELSFFDQLIFRFSKLQDSMGSRLFPILLENLGEESKRMPFIDQLVKLEELNILSDAEEWMVLRETRNIVTHEYPFVAEEVIQGLNLLFAHSELISKIWDQINEYIDNRFET